MATQSGEDQIVPGRPYDVKSPDGVEYKFSQSLQEVDVYVPVPAGTRAKAMDVNLTRKCLKAGLKAQPPLIEGELFADIKLEESTWTVEEQKLLVIHLEKIKDQMQWWPHVVTTHPKLDVTKIQPENSKLDELDGDTRGMVEKMMYDQRQKEMGKPTSDEAKRNEMLEKFMKQHPEMDFSQAKIN